MRRGLQNTILSALLFAGLAFVAPSSAFAVGSPSGSTDGSTPILPEPQERHFHWEPTSCIWIHDVNLSAQEVKDFTDAGTLAQEIAVRSRALIRIDLPYYLPYEKGFYSIDTSLVLPHENLEGYPVSLFLYESNSASDYATIMIRVVGELEEAPPEEGGGEVLPPDQGGETTPPGEGGINPPVEDEIVPPDQDNELAPPSEGDQVPQPLPAATYVAPTTPHLPVESLIEESPQEEVSLQKEVPENMSKSLSPPIQAPNVQTPGILDVLAGSAVYTASLSVGVAGTFAASLFAEIRVIIWFNRKKALAVAAGGLFVGKKRLSAG